MSVNANLNQITFQSSLRSKPVRENFTDTENALNDLQSQINALATPPAGTEVTNARDNHTVLRDRLRSESMINGNVLISGGVVSDQTVPDMTVHIAAGEAIVDGVACKWAAQDSGTITAPVSNTRLDYVVVNSDNSISIVAGTPGASPVFPAVASSQLVVAALVVKAATTSLNDNVEVFVFRHKPSYMEDIYIGSALNAYQGIYVFGNLIVDADVAMDCNASGLSGLHLRYAHFKCSGYFYITSGKSLTITNTAESYFDNGESGSTAGGNSGGAGGGASACSSGGAGTAGSGGGAGGAGGVGGAIDASSSKDNFVAGRTATYLSNTAGSLFGISAHSIYVLGTISNNGGDGLPASGEAASGAGVTCLFAREDIVISGAINLVGGDPKSNAAGYGGKGGGAGGLFVARSKTFTNTGSVDVSGGPGGAGNTTGNAGGDGVEDQLIYGATADIANCRYALPFIDVFGIK